MCAIGFTSFVIDGHQSCYHDYNHVTTNTQQQLPDVYVVMVRCLPVITRQAAEDTK